MKKIFPVLASLALLLGAMTVFADDDVRPMTSKSLDKKESQTTKKDKPATNWPAQSWLMPAEKIESSKYSDLKEEDKIGAYGQPRWTAHRRFTENRIYVMPGGEIDLEFWAVAKVKKHSKGGKYLTKTEVEFGLTHRFQFDLYFITRTVDKGKKATKNRRETFYDFAPELRYALADWGELWGNPTVYLEYKLQQDTADNFETKLLFGDEITSRWHWGTNLVWEQDLSGSKKTELALCNAISYTLWDEKFSVGAEIKTTFENKAGKRDDWEKAVVIGPSIQYKPLPRMHIDFAALFGLTDDSNLVTSTLVVGWEF